MTKNEQINSVARSFVENSVGAYPYDPDTGGPSDIDLGYWMGINAIRDISLGVPTSCEDGVEIIVSATLTVYQKNGYEAEAMTWDEPTKYELTISEGEVSDWQSI